MKRKRGFRRRTGVVEEKRRKRRRRSNVRWPFRFRSLNGCVTTLGGAAGGREGALHWPALPAVACLLVLTV